MLVEGHVLAAPEVPAVASHSVPGGIPDIATPRSAQPALDQVNYPTGVARSPRKVCVFGVDDLCPRHEPTALAQGRAARGAVLTEGRGHSKDDGRGLEAEGRRASTKASDKFLPPHQGSVYSRGWSQGLGKRSLGY